jgi:hypothetical protein
MNKDILPAVGAEVTFSTRKGHIVGYSTFTRHDVLPEYRTYAIVELDAASGGFLDKTKLPSHRRELAEDMYVSLVIINPQNFDTVNGEDWNV